MPRSMQWSFERCCQCLSEYQSQSNRYRHQKCTALLTTRLAAAAAAAKGQQGDGRIHQCHECLAFCLCCWTLKNIFPKCTKNESNRAEHGTHHNNRLQIFLQRRHLGDRIHSNPRTHGWCNFKFPSFFSF